MVSRNSNGHNLSHGCPIQAHNIFRCSKLNIGSSREIPMVITSFFLRMQMYATFILKCSKCRLCIQQCNAMESCTIFMTFFPIFVIFILIWFFFILLFALFFLFVENKYRLFFLKYVITHASSSYLLQISLGIPSECMLCLI